MSRRLLTAARWPAGIAITSWSYMWRVTPMHRDEVEGALPEDLPPELPAGVDLDGVQRVSDGTGPLFHRLYSTRVRESRLTAEGLIERVGRDPNEVTPGAFTKFHKERGSDEGMSVGDEFLVRMPGPWDGPVRCIARTRTSFRFATLDGHLEAGQIEWRARDGAETLQFQVESWSRPGDRLSSFMHHRLRMAKEVQLHMWTSVLERVPKLCGGRMTGGIEIHTRVADF
jgi:uncharacterized protein DUF1990